MLAAARTGNLGWTDGKAGEEGALVDFGGDGGGGSDIAHGFGHEGAERPCRRDLGEQLLSARAGARTSWNARVKKVGVSANARCWAKRAAADA